MGLSSSSPEQRYVASAWSCGVVIVWLQYGMSNVSFDWDDRKSLRNKKKHGISFEEATSVFYDEFAILIDDPEHSLDEERFILLGLSSTLRILVVCHCYREADDVIRIISARKATRVERGDYRGK